VSDIKHTINMLRPFYRGLPVILLAMILSVIAAKVYLHYATPKYESASYIKLADAAIGIPHSTLYRDLDVFATSSNILAEVEMVKSQVVIDRALKHLDLGITIFQIGELRKQELYDQTPFRIIARPTDQRGYDSTYKMLVYQDSLLVITSPGKVKYKGKLNHLLSTPYLDLIVRKNDSLLAVKPDIQVVGKYELIVNAHQTLRDYIKQKIDVMETDKEVPVLRIAFKTAVAQKSADIVNEISEAYIRDYIDEKYSAADTTVNFLDKEVNNYSQKLITAEKTMENYKQDKGVINIKQETETNIRSLSELKTKLAGLQMDLIAIDSLNHYIQNGKADFNKLAPNFQTFNDLLSTEIIKKVKSLQEEKKDLLLKYTPEHEQVQAVDNKLNDLYAYMEESINNTRTNLQLKFVDLQKTIRETEASMESYPEKDRMMTVLDRNFNLNDQIYRFLREKRTDAEIARAANISFHRIITMAEVPVLPVFPVPILMLVLGALLGLIFGTLGVYVIHFMKGKVNNEVSIERNSEIPVQACIPYFKTAAQAEVAFQKLAIDLQVKKSLEKGAILAITSFDKGEGKRTVSLGLAKAITSLGKTCVILDADGTLEGKGSSFPDIQPAFRWGEQWFQPDRLAGIIRELQDNYELVICKTAPLSKNASSLLLLAPATMTLFIMDSRITKMKRVEEAGLLQQELSLDNIHFLLNREGYTPSLIRQVFRRIMRIFGKTRVKPPIV
jgi:uncharacterized protein involved in exopolysaccharide biosynthesis